ncbi:hypothetical protein HAX54_044734, partial [Datura stramonium]|nr:hypothetical protein [Datura stramonium]
IMELKGSKGMETKIARKGLKRLQKGTKGASSSKARARYAKFFEKEAKYAPENWIDEGLLELEFAAIRDKLCELGVGYIFPKKEECNLTLVREFYANWDTSFGESTSEDKGSGRAVYLQK